MQSSLNIRKRCTYLHSFHNASCVFYLSPSTSLELMSDWLYPTSYVIYSTISFLWATDYEYYMYITVTSTTQLIETITHISHDVSIIHTYLVFV